MKIHVLNLHLSRLGGGIYTVIKELYQTERFRNSVYSEIHFWGYEDEFSNVDTRSLFGRSHTFLIKNKVINKIFFSWKLRKTILQNISASDILHLHSLWLYLSIIVTFAKKKTTSKKIISTHGMLDEWALKNRWIKKRIALLFFENKNFKTADCIHALCEQEYKDIRKINKETPIAIISNGINLPSCNGRSIENQTKILVYLGRIHQKKGLANLIRSWANVTRTDWKLIIAGPDENSHLKELETFAKKLEVHNSIEFCRPRFGKEKEELLYSADAFILPSFSEGLPMSVLEAWSYKLPVLMTPECNLPDGFETDSAIKIETNPESIAIGLKKLFAMSDSERRKMGENGYALVKEKYTWDFVASQMIELYDWVLGKREKPGFVRLD
jgi:poly(glycerol-phosphate) alpha-glucosyltransferase